MKHSLGFLALVNAAKKKIREVSPAAVMKRLGKDPSLLLVDVREDHEWDEGHIAGAVHLGKGIIERDIENVVPDKQADIVLYCGGGFRSALSADNLRKMGYRNVASMKGGWRQWNTLRYPIVGKRPKKK